MDEELIKRRLLIYMGLRFVGLMILFLGLAIMYSNLLRKGGWPQLGAIFVLIGVLESVLAPRLLKRRWDRQ